MNGWDTSELDGLIKDLDEVAPRTEALTRTVVKKIGHDTVTLGQNKAPVDTGNLKNSIGVDPIDDWMGFEAGPTAAYGADVEYGTEPHEIKARNAGALFWEGAEHPVKSIQHPGTDPQPYMRPAFDQATEPLDKVMAQIAKKAIT
ncbi:HK97-gp10 family putative phage morphogenesis protein [Nonomuraea rubra]|uniref:HK97 gp10 family phage protein n=1 Tax=Nonomuraea rubra TaxID=46180 RepID=A0A7X0P6U6_9ACTN|nr:HK97-gp10 family putative phage morphogenesis protein [Nonomuraea rubra]MBB6556146.1 HK97 gp10 family phage protein [Nonomuraea rubra]